MQYKWLQLKAVSLCMDFEEHLGFHTPERFCEYLRCHTTIIWQAVNPSSAKATYLGPGGELPGYPNSKSYASATALL